MLETTVVLRIVLCLQMDNVMRNSNIQEDYFGISAVHFGYVNIVSVKLCVYRSGVLMRVCPSVIGGVGWGWGCYHVTITHDEFDLTVQSTASLQAWVLREVSTPANVIWWPSLKKCSNLFTLVSPHPLVLTSGGY